MDSEHGASGLDFVLSVNVRVMVQRSSAMASNGFQQDDAARLQAQRPSEVPSEN